MEAEVTLVFQPDHIYLLNYYALEEEIKVSFTEWYKMVIQYLEEKNILYKRILIDGETLTIDDSYEETAKFFTSICEVILDNNQVYNDRRKYINGYLSLDIGLFNKLNEITYDVRVIYSAKYG